MTIKTKSYLGIIILLTVSFVQANSTRAQDELGEEVIRGAHLYDNWPLKLGVETPEGNHPLWESQENENISAARTWLCKTCHAWDYRGADGAIGTAYPSLLQLSDLPKEEVLGWLDGTSNPDHDYSELMEVDARNHLVVFLQSGLLDVSSIADYETRIAVGDIDSGADLYNQTCAECHAVDGSMLNFGSAEQPAFIGDLALRNPWRFLHRIRFGLPNYAPHTFAAILGSLEQAADLLAYAQTLPLAPPPSDALEPELEIISLEGEGDTKVITIGAVIIVLVILIGIAWPAYQKRNR
jgi:thiosulfate dehydrogenase